METYRVTLPNGNDGIVIAPDKMSAAKMVANYHGLPSSFSLVGSEIRPIDVTNPMPVPDGAGRPW